MATLKRFEDIEAWQVARKLTREIYGPYREKDGSQKILVCKIKSDGPPYPSCRILLKDSSGVAPSNFLSFLSIAKGSTGEIEAQLYVAFDQGYVNREQS